ncbi:multidrug ABC transporter ATP-binding protein [Carnobacterium maltaromaticum]|uniref:ABC transporter ATP-binding protein n=1 Tax=Carnobacterium maltaromaticum TaxID=2751 RepID=UPI000C7819A3|nr:ABC transporter ATP-binding protein [Carnobacterium maltaromaticum]PLS33876.1 multidrug ABC transporter ATP-binding protein [Carnobacterium maltaromaticum]PLS35857.1 multidrug ABC transporter ATP-binding protein [Carnobacterium maltaromaticum]PLS36307.1 multidrug ABC transporter ATP-binding protein [Carnobacterium maltaromaticum]PLS42764.1 multidrug ABC transporter ATP-binding protein [Carnobacterium maltaromaticum]PLS43000.1 multidrug ABC transporter ATP-binding protein [Carnobacterium mal
MSLKVTNLTGGYSQVPVLKYISFEVEKGKLIGLIGLNGAGKSTAIKHIIGLMNPQKGSITIDELTLTADTEGYRKKFAFIPETPVLYEELTLKEHIELTAMAYDVPQDIAFQRAEKLLTSFRLSNKLDWFPANFSKGMKQKVMILCAFLVEPSLYIIDEPFLGLDPLGINALLELMNEMKEQGASILMSTHILATAERQCDGFVLLHNGEIKAQGTLEDLRASFQMPEATLDEIYIHLTKEEDQLNDDA